MGPRARQTARYQAPESRLNWATFHRLFSLLESARDANSRNPVCETEEFIPYVCRYCGRTHCVLHRLPENHECPNIQQARAPRQPIVLERRRTGTTLRLLQSPRIGVMPRRELVALSVAWIVLGISFSTRYMFPGRFTTPVAFLEVFLFTMLVIGTGFLGHELAHKFTAQRYGAWCKVRPCV